MTITSYKRKEKRDSEEKNVAHDNLSLAELENVTITLKTIAICERK